jgi:hypothetical protein
MVLPRLPAALQAKDDVETIRFGHVWTRVYHHIRTGTGPKFALERALVAVFDRVRARIVTPVRTRVGGRAISELT